MNKKDVLELKRRLLQTAAGMLKSYGETNIVREIEKNLKEQ